ncbi:MAG: YqaE/Pmp3 family membrane protein [Sulfurospirillaceae bacterium]|jgi:uncharacterized membrane protein YqaE (UPF0057 family)|nr:YqaE/Pmp3 family membrane protein [Sulfurospirillaceae bacterium]MDY0238688.1 YqaE/Pmp3 family membrane protein [Campylobacterales bacterium]MDY0238697.1 YqaE/Pmp3 family membrane protein [Campylobacterales bacterium]NLM98812.1 YqaE/Pmp3 family membrane protein [Campylobacteraceae bacterium]
MSRLVLILLAIFLPPVAVFLKKGIMPTFWINLILTLCFFFPGMVHALFVVTKNS